MRQLVRRKTLETPYVVSYIAFKTLREFQSSPENAPASCLHDDDYNAAGFFSVAGAEISEPAAGPRESLASGAAGGVPAGWGI